MGEIPGFAWLGAGFFIGVVSLFMGFIKPVEHSAFFKLMTAIGIGMVAYGYIFKIKMKERTTQQMMEERRQQTLRRGDNEVEIDIDDYRNNPHLRQQVLQKARGTSGNTGHPHSQTRTPSHYGTQGNYNYGNLGIQNNPYNQRNTKQPHLHSNTQHQRQQPASPSSGSYSNPSVSQSTHSQAQRFCTGCGTPLLKHHKYCPICGNRV